MKCYTAGIYRLKKAYKEGICVSDEGVISTDGSKGVHLICLPPFLGEGKEDWGRLQVFAGERSKLKIYAAASWEKEKMWTFLNDGMISAEKKTRLLRENGIAVQAYQENILLHGLCGKYLWIAAEVEEPFAAEIYKITVTVPGDVFFPTFPEVFREQGEIFYRLIAAFSSLYCDCKKRHERMWEKLDLNKADSEQLAVMAGWFGADVGEGLLEIDIMRKFVEAIPHLLHVKGTKKAVRKLTCLITGEDPCIVEREQGKVTLLMKKKLSQDDELKLLFFLKQFSPVYVRISIVSYEEEVYNDAYCFVDMNACIPIFPQAFLDTDYAADMSYVSE